ncbi:MAG: hypothetical protein ACRD2B_01875 [Terriglobia bacterium]
MANSREDRVKKIWEKAEREAEETGRGIKKGATEVEHLIQRISQRRPKKQGKQ